MSETVQKKEFSIAGVALTIIVTAGFVWGSVQWFNNCNRGSQSGAENVSANEIQAFENLQSIARAQAKYVPTDWDGDKKKNYAAFFVHLWMSVSSGGEQIPVKLIPEKLAFAIAPARAIDGYYFIDLHSRAAAEKEETDELDYEKEWAIAGAPAAASGKRSVIFITDVSGDVFVKNNKIPPLQYPHDPLSNGWTKIETIEQLKDFQKTLDNIN